MNSTCITTQGITKNNYETDKPLDFSLKCKNAANVVCNLETFTSFVLDVNVEIIKTILIATFS